VPNFLFDCKLFASVRIDAPDEATARRVAREVLDCAPLLDYGAVQGEPGCTLHPSEVSVDGDLDLIEVDGEDPDAIAEERES
jgi:hypothetical protein